MAGTSTEIPLGFIHDGDASRLAVQKRQLGNGKIGPLMARGSMCPSHKRLGERKVRSPRFRRAADTACPSTDLGPCHLAWAGITLSGIGGSIIIHADSQNRPTSEIRKTLFFTGLVRPDPDHLQTNFTAGNTVGDGNVVEISLDIQASMLMLLCNELASCVCCSSGIRHPTNVDWHAEALRVATHER